MSYNEIPEEIRGYPQWVMWRYEEVADRSKPTKVPYTPLGVKADVTDAGTWSTFDTVVATEGYDGIGFVFSDFDPYCGIDLDDTGDDAELLARHREIHNAFNSYSELSPSGRGLHIIVKGSVPTGRRRDSVKCEVYSRERYFTFTGKALGSTREIVADKQDILSILWNELQEGKSGRIDITQFVRQASETDQQVHERALNADNGSKYAALCTGDGSVLESADQSGSAIDQGIVNILQFYTKDPEQIERIWCATPHGQREKTQTRPAYRAATIQRAFDRELPSVDISGLTKQVEAFIRSTQSAGSTDETISQASGAVPMGSIQCSLPSAEPPTQIDAVSGVSPAHQAASDLPASPDSSTKLPSGLVGEIAQYIYQSSPYPIQEIALTASLGLMAGICGRSFNISNTGLNLYLLTLAGTGMGKEELSKGPNRVINAVRPSVPAIDQFIGPGMIASGQALIKSIAEAPHSMVSTIGEFGYTMQRLADPRAPQADKTLKAVLLDLYNKSSYGASLKRMVYSDKEKNIPDVPWPAFTIIAESVPETFYSVVDDRLVVDGLLPRFIIVEHKGKRPYINKAHADVRPDEGMLQRVADLAAMSHQIMHNQQCMAVQQTGDAGEFFDWLEKTCTDQINDTKKPRVERELWNRVYQNTLKVAALIAIGINEYQPTVGYDEAKWAYELVANATVNLAHRFEIGDCGSGGEETDQIKAVIAYFQRWLTKDANELSATERKYQVFHSQKLVPWSVISQRLGSSAVFKTGRISGNLAVKNAVEVLKDREVIVELNDTQKEAYNTRQRLFMSNGASIFEA